VIGNVRIREVQQTQAWRIISHAKAWRMGVIQHTRYPVDPAIKMDMKNVSEPIVTGSFALSQKELGGIGGRIR
jgi:hypothetical protein